MNNKPDSKVEVKCCPFCGHKPKLLDNLNVHCNNKMCVLYCRVFWHEHWSTRSPIANNGVSLEEFRMHVLNVLKKRFPHVGEKSYENIKDAQDEILAKLQPTAPRGGGDI